MIKFPLHTIPAILFVAFALVACSSSNSLETDGPKFVGTVFKTLTGPKSGPEMDNPLNGLSRSQLSKVPGPVWFAHLKNIQAYSALTLIGENNGVQTFLTPDQVSLSFRSGFIISTRGLGADLLSAEVSMAIQALKTGDESPYQRVHRLLDGEDHTIIQTFSCTLSKQGIEHIEILEIGYNTQTYIERCQDGTLSFQNKYWTSSKGVKIYQSHQFVSNKMGYIDLQLLIE